MCHKPSKCLRRYQSVYDELFIFSSNILFDFYCSPFSQTIKVKKILSLLCVSICLFCLFKRSLCTFIVLRRVEKGLASLLFTAGNYRRCILVTWGLWDFLVFLVGWKRLCFRFVLLSIVKLPYYELQANKCKFFSSRNQAGLKYEFYGAIALLLDLMMKLVRYSSPRGVSITSGNLPEPLDCFRTKLLCGEWKAVK